MSRREFDFGQPSPVPTGKGLRSSAVNDGILTDYLNKSLQIPELKLPISAQSRNLSPPQVDFGSIREGDPDSVKQILKSAGESGIFMIEGHGISAREMDGVSKWIAANGGDGENLRGLVLDWAPDKEEESEMNLDLGPDPDTELRYRFKTSFSNESYRRGIATMERKLAEIAELLRDVMSRKHLKEFGTTQGETSSRSVRILNTKADYRLSLIETFSKDKYGLEVCEPSDLGLYLPLCRCEVLVQTGSRSFVLESGPETILVIVGQQLKVQSPGRFSSVPGNITFIPVVEARDRPTIVFSVSFKFTQTMLEQHTKQLNRTISIADQIHIAVVIVFLFKFAFLIYRSAQSYM